MDQTALHLHEVGLGHMMPGWLGYRVVTRNVYQAMEDGRFRNPDKFKRTVPEFADLAYDVPRCVIEGRLDDLSPNWEVPVLSNRLRRAGAGVNMWAFWRGHIPDLTKALIVTDTLDSDEADFNDIDFILGESVPQVMAEISVQPSLLATAGCYMAMHDAYILRAAQWQEFKRLQGLGWNSNNARDEIIPGVYPHDCIRTVVQTVGDFTLRLTGADGPSGPLEQQTA